MARPKQRQAEPDVNQTAFAVVQQATRAGPTPLMKPNQSTSRVIAKHEPPKPPGQAVIVGKMQHPKNPAAVALGKLGGAKGGKARAEALSPKKRAAIAQKAARARWAKRP